LFASLGLGVPLPPPRVLATAGKARPATATGGKKGAGAPKPGGGKVSADRAPILTPLVWQPHDLLLRDEFRASQRIAAATHGIVTTAPMLSPEQEHLGLALRVCANPEVLATGKGKDAGKSTQSDRPKAAGKTAAGGGKTVAAEEALSGGSGSARRFVSLRSTSGGGKPAWDGYGAHRPVDDIATLGAASAMVVHAVTDAARDGTLPSIVPSAVQRDYEARVALDLDAEARDAKARDWLLREKAKKGGRSKSAAARKPAKGVVVINVAAAEAKARAVALEAARRVPTDIAVAAVQAQATYAGALATAIASAPLPASTGGDDGDKPAPPPPPPVAAVSAMASLAASLHLGPSRPPPAAAVGGVPVTAQAAFTAPTLQQLVAGLRTVRAGLARRRGDGTTSVRDGGDVSASAWSTGRGGGAVDSTSGDTVYVARGGGGPSLQRLFPIHHHALLDFSRRRAAVHRLPADARAVMHGGAPADSLRRPHTARDAEGPWRSLEPHPPPTPARQRLSAHIPLPQLDPALPGMRLLPAGWAGPASAVPAAPSPRHVGLRPPAASMASDGGEGASIAMDVPEAAPPGVAMPSPPARSALSASRLRSMPRASAPLASPKMSDAAAAAVTAPPPVAVFQLARLVAANNYPIEAASTTRRARRSASTGVLPAVAAALSSSGSDTVTAGAASSSAAASSTAPFAVEATAGELMFAVLAGVGVGLTLEEGRLLSESLDQLQWATDRGDKTAAEAHVTGTADVIASVMQRVAAE